MLLNILGVLAAGGRKEKTSPPDAIKKKEMKITLRHVLKRSQKKK